MRTVPWCDWPPWSLCVEHIWCAHPYINCVRPIHTRRCVDWNDCVSWARADRVVGGDVDDAAAACFDCGHCVGCCDCVGCWVNGNCGSCRRLLRHGHMARCNRIRRSHRSRNGLRGADAGSIGVASSICELESLQLDIRFKAYFFCHSVENCSAMKTKNTTERVKSHRKRKNTEHQDSKG